MFSVDVLTAAPADEEPLPVLAKALVAALRAELVFKAVAVAVLDVEDDWLLPDMTAVAEAGAGISDIARRSRHFLCPTSRHRLT